MANRVIHKHKVEVDDQDNIVFLAPGAIILEVLVTGNDPSKVTFWESHETQWLDKADVRHVFRVFGTGQVIPENYVYIGTTYWEHPIDPTRNLVWHLHKKKDEE